MIRQFFAGVFLIGALAVLWVAYGFFGTNVLALLMTCIIGATFGVGALELHRFRQATLTLTKALSSIPDNLTDLSDWLSRIHPSLQNATRLRIEGERVGLPGPTLSTYLVGLLVMLGMLGTFLGMVVTLNGAVFALEGTTDLQAIRSAFAAPIKGLGLAFGTSVAGVATSAMLGLMSAIARRERIGAAQLLDTQIATVLRGFSLTFQRQETFKALQLQSQALPAVAQQLQAMMEKMEGMNQQLSEQLLNGQQRFQSEVKDVFVNLADSVGHSLRTSLELGAQAASESLKPVLATAMLDLSQETKLQHERVMSATQLQLDGLCERFGATASGVTDAWTSALANQERTSAALVTGLGQSLDAFGTSFGTRSGTLFAELKEAYATLQTQQTSLDRQRMDTWTSQLQDVVAALMQEWQQSGAHARAQQQQICSALASTAQEITEQARTHTSKTLDEIARLVASSEEVVRTRLVTEAHWAQQHGARMDDAVGAWRTEMGALREQEALHSQAAIDRLGELQAAVAHHLTTLGTALEDPITRLVHTASEAPKAAAEVIGQLRQEISNSVARDNDLLQERSRIMGTLNALLETINHASTEQRSVIDALVASSAQALDRAGTEFSEKVDAETAKLADIAASVTSSSVEVSVLGESLGVAVTSFSDANEKLIASLQRMEGAMDKSTARSDEQLAYYIAQAREIIDLSVTSQREIVEGLRQLPTRQALPSAEVA